MKSIKRQALEKVGEQIDWDRVRENATKAEVYRVVAAAFDAGVEAAAKVADDHAESFGSFGLLIAAAICQLKEG